MSVRRNRGKCENCRKKQPTWQHGWPLRWAIFRRAGQYIRMRVCCRCSGNSEFVRFTEQEAA
jgi:hypothetical protein